MVKLRARSVQCWAKLNRTPLETADWGRLLWEGDHFGGPPTSQVLVEVAEGRRYVEPRAATQLAQRLEQRQGDELPEPLQPTMDLDPAKPTILRPYCAGGGSAEVGGDRSVDVGGCRQRSAEVGGRPESVEASGGRRRSTEVGGCCPRCGHLPQRFHHEAKRDTGTARF